MSSKKKKLEQKRERNNRPMKVALELAAGLDTDKISDDAVWWWDGLARARKLGLVWPIGDGKWGFSEKVKQQLNNLIETK